MKKLFALAVCLSLSTGLARAAGPGEGVEVIPVQSTVAEETFQTLLVVEALKALDYDVQSIREVDYNVGYTSIANGDATFLAVNWNPLHKDKYIKAGGDEAFYRQNHYITGAAQGYLIDKKTAQKHGIDNIADLKDPELARLFDTNGDGKADLSGCNPGWGCEAVIEHHLDAYGLRDTVTHKQGKYSAIIADTIARYRNGQPILYYTWTPYWVSGVLVPGEDVVWLEVPFSALPGAREDVDTTLPNGKNYGFQMNTMDIVANREFAENNPAAAKLFAIMRLPINDVSAQNMRMQQGENSQKDIRRHVKGWIKAHQETFDSWIRQARAAAK